MTTNNTSNTVTLRNAAGAILNPYWAEFQAATARADFKAADTARFNALWMDREAEGKTCSFYHELSGGWHCVTCFGFIETQADGSGSCSCEAWGKTCLTCSQPTGGAIFCSAACHNGAATQHRVCTKCENALAMDDQCEVCRDCAAAEVEKGHAEQGSNFCKECGTPIADIHKFCSAFCAEDFFCN